MSSSRIIAEYLVETPATLEAAAASIAGEQSTGTFTSVPGETEELVRRHGATVESIEPLGYAASPSLPGAAPPKDPARGWPRGRVRISFPAANVGPNLAALTAMIAGNLFELRILSGLRLLDFDLPADLAAEFAGPQFGIAGTRRLAGVEGRPIIGTIVKPSIGLTPRQTADLVRTLAVAGIDFVKDDELLSNQSCSPLADRVKAVMAAVHEAAETTGRKVMVAFNISDRLDRMLAHHDTVVAAGGTCVMVSLNGVGLAGVEHLRRHATLPIHGHRNGWGAVSRHPALGMEFRAYQKLWRLAGIDQIHVNGLQNKFCEADESVVRSIEACLEPCGPVPAVMPVVSSGQWGGQAPETFARTRTVDLMYLAGGGILAHPGGATAGVTAIRQAWEAAVAGASLVDYARDRPALRQSLEFYGALPRPG
jgi:ribulose-bisphosphate carboxylase large chain